MSNALSTALSNVGGNFCDRHTSYAIYRLKITAPIHVICKITETDNMHKRQTKSASAKHQHRNGQSYDTYRQLSDLISEK